MKKILMTISFVLLIALQMTESFAQGKSYVCLHTRSITDNAFEYELEKNPDAKCQKVYTALRNAAETVVFGGAASDYDVASWVRSMNSSAEYLKSFDSQFFDSSAETFLKAKLAAEKLLRTKTVTNAYLDAHGRTPTKIEIFAYDKLMQDQRSWYSHALAGEVTTMNKLPKVREEMINRAYLATTGKSANAGDLQYWKPRSEHYKLIVKAISK